MHIFDIEHVVGRALHGKTIICTDTQIEMALRGIKSRLYEHQKKPKPGSLSAYNAAGKLTKSITERPALNGINCDKCDNELYDVGRCIMISNPAQADVFCNICLFIGRRDVTS